MLASPYWQIVVLHIMQKSRNKGQCREHAIGRPTTTQQKQCVLQVPMFT